LAPATGAPGLGGLFGAFTAGVLASRLAGCATASVDAIAAADAIAKKIRMFSFPLKVDDAHKLLSSGECSCVAFPTETDHESAHQHPLVLLTRETNGQRARFLMMVTARHWLLP
jgi:hypothetical protein